MTDGENVRAMLIPGVSIIVPALNECVLVEDTVNEITRAVEVLDEYELILVNDGSSDDTGNIMEKIAERNPKVKVIHHQVNLGLGAGYRSGVQRADQPYVVMFPGDNSFGADSMRELFSHLGEADIIIPYHLNSGTARNFIRRFVSATYTWLANFLSGEFVPYYNGTVIHRTDLVRDFGVRSNGFAYQLDILVRMLKAGYSYQAVGIYLQERVSGKTKAFSFRNLSQVALVLLTLLFKKK